MLPGSNTSAGSAAKWTPTVLFVGARLVFVFALFVLASYVHREQASIITLLCVTSLGGGTLLHFIGHGRLATRALPSLFSPSKPSADKQAEKHSKKDTLVHAGLTALVGFFTLLGLQQAGAIFALLVGFADSLLLQLPVLLCGSCLRKRNKKSRLNGPRVGGRLILLAVVLLVLFARPLSHDEVFLPQSPAGTTTTTTGTEQLLTEQQLQPPRRLLLAAEDGIPGRTQAAEQRLFADKKARIPVLKTYEVLTAEDAGKGPYVAPVPEFTQRPKPSVLRQGVPDLLLERMEAKQRARRHAVVLPGGIEIAETSMGVLYLLLAGALELFRARWGRKIVKGSGGVKRLHVNAQIYSGLMCLPLVILSVLTQAVFTADPATTGTATTVEGDSEWYVHILYYVFFTGFFVVLRYYLGVFKDKLTAAENTSPTETNFSFLSSASLPLGAAQHTLKTHRMDFVVCMFGAIACDIVREDTAMFTPMVLVSIALMYYALTKQLKARLDGTNLQLQLNQTSAVNLLKQSKFNVKETCGTLARIWKHIKADQNTFRIFLFVCINMAFMFVELFYGFWTNSLGLISDAGHMFFDCVALLIGLYASYISSIKANSTYTYGYGRFEILSGFINGVFLVFVGFFVFVEGLERLFEEPEITSDSLVLVSVLGFLVNLIGIFFFHDASHGHSHGGGGGDHGHSHGGEEGENMNMTGIYLHIVADALGSVGVIVSSLCIKWFDWTAADAICSIFISLLILMSVIPFLAASTDILLTRVPGKSQQRFNRGISFVQHLPEVVAVEDVKVWSFTDGQSVATLHLTIDHQADSQQVLQQVTQTLKDPKTGGVSSLTVQINQQDTHLVQREVKQNSTTTTTTTATANYQLHAQEPEVFLDLTPEPLPVEQQHGHSHGEHAHEHHGHSHDNASHGHHH